MSDAVAPWREITTDDYHPRIFPATSPSAPWIALSDRVYALLEEQHRGECRLRLILREAVDLKRSPKADPLWYWDYDAGPPAITCVAETCIDTKNGPRGHAALGACGVMMAPHMLSFGQGSALDGRSTRKAGC